MTDSILSFENVQRILATAKENLKCDKFLQPVLFIQLATGEHLAAPVELSGTTAEKVFSIRRISYSLLEEGKTIEEAILLGEGWFVAAKEPHELSVPPSQHPDRREAIFLMGRNAKKTRIISIVQPFVWGANGEPIWQHIELNDHDGQPGRDTDQVGLLDYLFVQERTEQPA